jgi:hypothetical protein
MKKKRDHNKPVFEGSLDDCRDYAERTPTDTSELPLPSVDDWARLLEEWRRRKEAN